MVTGWLTLACLLLAPTPGAPAAPDNVWYTSQHSFQIPIKINPERRADVKELILFASTDEGNNWRIFARSGSDKDAFTVNNAPEGSVWFSIAVVDQSGRQDPADPRGQRPGQKVFVDAIKPEVQIVSAERIGNEIDIHWEVREANPDWQTLRLDYSVADVPGGQPVPLPIQPGEHGTYKLKVNVPGPVTLRLQLKDRAGNEGVCEKVVPGGNSSAAASGLQTISATAPADRGVLSPVSSGPGLMPPPSPTPDHTPISSSSMSPVTKPTPIGSSGDVPAHSGSSSSPIAGGSVPANAGALPPLRIVNKKQVKIDFDVTDYGPSGVGSVDVYVTTDEGATWELTKAEPGTMPVVGDGKGSGPLTGSVSALLPKDGVIYGFYLVVKSRAGLGQDPPRSGDVPQLRVELDTLPPKAELYAPQPESGRGDVLRLAWWAEDRNLATNPVTLEWAAQKEGPWEFIGDAQLPNSGKFSWTVPQKIPPQVYLRLTVRDTAGNTAIAQTPNPVMIDLNKPKPSNIRVSSSR
jgi:hypothetical protein